MRGGLKNQALGIEKLRFVVVVSRTCGGARLAERDHMTTSRAVYVAVLCLTAGLASGCDLYFGGGDDTVCAYGTGTDGGGAIAPAQEVRDPATGQCQYVGWGGGGGCDTACGPCAEVTNDEALPPDWGSCYGHCNGLDAGSCLATPGCYGAYLETSDEAPDTFWACWDTAPSGPVGGSCANLDAYQCSRHDNCVGVFANGQYGQQFVYCEAEPTVDPGSCATTTCGPGHHCEEQCYPSSDPTTPNTMDSCSPVCVQDLTCASVDCGPGYSCADTCAVDSNGQVTCNATCVPSQNPGGCYGTITCATPSPACPMGTTPGTANGCYTGYCIPVNQCPLPACETLSTEHACVSRGDCTPVYEGTNCTCYPNGCTCEILTYERCESHLMPL